MKAFRLLLYCLVLLLLLLAGAGAYLYPRLPSFVERQAQIYLSDYGVHELELGPLHFSAGQFSLDSLRLVGDIDGLAFDLSLSGVELDYALGELWQGRVAAVTLARMDASVRETLAAPVSEYSPIVLSELSPHTVLSALPVGEVSVGQWQLDYQPLTGEPLTADGSLQWNGELALAARAFMSGARVVGKLGSPDGATLALGLEGFAGGTSLATMQAAGKQGEQGDWHWGISGALEFAPLLSWLREQGLQGDAAALDLVGSSLIQAKLSHPDQLMPPQDMAREFIAQFDGSLGARSSIAGLSWPGVVDETSGTIDTAVHLSAGAIEVALGPAQIDASLPAAVLQLPAETLQWLRWKETVPLRWRNSGEALFRQTPEGGWAVRLENNRLLLGGQDSQLQLGGITLDATVDMRQAVSLVAQLGATLDIRLRQQQLPQMRLALSQHGPLDNTVFDLGLGDTAQSLALSLGGELDVNTGQGVFLAELRSLDFPYASSTIVPLLQKFDLLAQEVVLDSGSFTLSSKLRSAGFSQDQMKQQARLHIDGLSGSYGEYQFEGVDVSAAWSGIEQWQTLEPAILSMSRLNVGFDVTDTRLSVALPRPTPLGQPVISIEQFESGMFGGQVYLPEPRRWDFSRDSNSITLRADDWRLEDIVALQAGQDIQARGTLEGELPVTVTSGRIIIEKGYLRARAPGGSIRYIANAASQALAVSSPELGQAMGLLEDFQYKTLSSEVDLDAGGNLLLGLSLEGSNPAQYQGRPIRFNINLEQNLDPLLQSLRLSDNLVEKVERGLR